MKKEKSEGEPTVEQEPEKVIPAMIAKKDFVIHQNETHIEIKAGDDLAGKIPEHFHENLKTEGVL